MARDVSRRKKGLTFSSPTTPKKAHHSFRESLGKESRLIVKTRV